MGLMTHLACADDPKHLLNRPANPPVSAINRGDLRRTKSIANSAAILSRPQAHCDWVRPGIMLYGASPFADKTAENEIRPVMTLISHLNAVRMARRGDWVGYGATQQCPEDMPIGVVAIGYGDGYPRHARSGTPVLVNGQICPLLGRVSMDMITVDLRAAPHAQVGDQVVLWGKGLPAEQIAACAETIAYELFCHVTKRVEFTTHG